MFFTTKIIYYITKLVLLSLSTRAFLLRKINLLTSGSMMHLKIVGTTRFSVRRTDTSTEDCE